MKKQIFVTVLFSMLAICSSTIAMQGQPKKSIAAQIIEGFQAFFKEMDYHNRRVFVAMNGENISLYIRKSTFFQYYDNLFEKRVYEPVYDFSPTYKKLQNLTTSREFTIDNSDLCKL